MYRNAFANTLLISLYKMISGFACPILLALAPFCHAFTLLS